ncbi:MAG: PQQ-dependent sugar dehydrogenase [Candidatus Paceibacterota bacterium]
MKKILLTIGVITVVVVSAFIFTNPVAWFFQPTSQSEPAATTTADLSTESELPIEDNDSIDEFITVIADNLFTPWGLTFLSDGNLLLTERPGRLLELSPEGDVLHEISISSHQRGESGLLGVAVHPDYAQNSWIYLYNTTANNDGLVNQVVRFRYEAGELYDRTVIIGGIAGAAYHDGGRIAFGPDGHLFILTGDATDTNLAQRTDNLEGKVLRVHDDGSIPEDNPFGNAVYTYGHRNPQGIAWHQSGQIFITEHGRSGARSGLDEINLLGAGRNYGWPYLEGDEICAADDIYQPSWPTGSECNGISPIEHSGPDITWAPASAAIAGDSLFFGGLRGQALYEATIVNTGTEIMVENVRTHFKGEYGRLRTVSVSPDGNYLYITTSNTDGRGNPATDDDKLIRVPLSRL